MLILTGRFHMIILSTSGYLGKQSSKIITVGGTITPTGKILRVGIIEPDGIRRCIYATGNFSYNFPLDKTGFYCVYAISDNMK